MQLTDDGFFKDPNLWSPDLARQRANELAIDYTDDVNRVVNAVRMFWTQSGIAPANRALLKLARVALNNASLSSIDLIDLFSDKPALNCARIAGIPRPKNCF